MDRNFIPESAQRQRLVLKQAERVDANHFFNVLTGPQLLETVEAHLPTYRERQYPPTLTLSMYLGQVWNADGSCQNALDEAAVNRLQSGLPMGSANNRRLLQRTATFAAGDGLHTGSAGRGVAG